MKQIKCLSFSYKVRAYSNINPAVKFFVNVNDNNLKIDEEHKRTAPSVFDDDKIKDDYETTSNDNLDLSNEFRTTTTKVNSYFSSFCASKSSFLEKLDVVGAFAVLGISPDTMKEPQQVHKIDIGISDLDSDSNSDYDIDIDIDIDEEMDLDNKSDDDNLDDYFLSDDRSQWYGEPHMATFGKDLMVSGTSVLRWLPLGAICQQKKKTTPHRKLSQKLMIIGVTDRAVVYAKRNIVKNNVFLHCNDIDLLTEEAANFKVEPFPNGWAKRKGHGKSYGVNYIEQYTEDLDKTFEAGIRNSSTK